MGYQVVMLDWAIVDVWSIKGHPVGATPRLVSIATPHPTGWAGTLVTRPKSVLVCFEKLFYKFILNSPTFCYKYLTSHDYPVHGRLVINLIIEGN